MLTRRLLGWFVMIVTGILNWYAFVWLFQWMGRTDSEFLATITLGSIALHEFGHQVVLEYYGVPCHVFFAVIFGGTIPDLKYGLDKFKKLNWHSTAKFSLAGVMVNALIIFVSYALYDQDIISWDSANRIMNMNASLIMFNMIPVGTLDGGRFAKAFFDSVPEKDDERYAMIIGYTVVIAAILIYQFGSGDRNPIILGWLVWKLRERADDDDPTGSRNPKAMTRKQINFWYVFYTALFVLSVAVTRFTQYVN